MLCAGDSKSCVRNLAHDIFFFQNKKLPSHFPLFSIKKILLKILKMEYPLKVLDSILASFCIPRYRSMQIWNCSKEENSCYSVNVKKIIDWENAGRKQKYWRLQPSVKGHVRKSITLSLSLPKIQCFLKIYAKDVMSLIFFLQSLIYTLNIIHPFLI